MGVGKLFTFIQTAYYATRAKKLLTDDDQRKVEELICENPFGGELQAGVRKIRIPLEGRGKSGGARVVYYFIERKGKVYLLDVFAKNQKASLTKAEQHEIRRLTKVLEAEA